MFIRQKLQNISTGEKFGLMCDRQT